MMGVFSEALKGNGLKNFPRAHLFSSLEGTPIFLAQSCTKNRHFSYSKKDRNRRRLVTSRRMIESLQ